MITMKVFSEMLNISKSEQILIDDKTNIITFPPRVQIIKDDLLFNSKTKGAVYVISKALKKDENLSPKLYYDKASDNYEIYFDSVVCVNKTANEVIDDIAYALNLAEKNIKTVFFCLIDYSLDGTYFSNATSKMSIEKIIYNYGIKAFKDSIKERVALMKQVKEFNKKLSSIKQFDFNFGNAFCGIKKLRINFDLYVTVKSNSIKALDVTPKKEDVLKELELFCFSAWKSVYNENKKPTFENAWMITLKLDGEVLEFKGLDDYPKTWNYVEYFVKKYGGFEEIKE